MSEIRVQKYIANSGVCSRRKSEELILEGRVKVNGKVITELGTKVDTDKDEIFVDGKKISVVKEYKYVLLNKPVRICNDRKRSI